MFKCEWKFDCCFAHFTNAWISYKTLWLWDTLKNFYDRVLLVIYWLFTSSYFIRLVCSFAFDLNLFWRFYSEWLKHIFGMASGDAYQSHDDIVKEINDGQTNTHTRRAKFSFIRIDVILKLWIQTDFSSNNILVRIYFCFFR